MADRRGSGGKDEAPVRRHRKQIEAPEQEQESEREENLPEQNLYGNSFLLGSLGAQRNDGDDGDDGGVEHDARQEFGGVEDDDGSTGAIAPEDERWFRPKFRKKGGEEVEPEGEDGPEDPGLPPEDDAWLASLEPEGEAWTDPAPQPLPAVLDGALHRWLAALLPVSGTEARQHAVATALCRDPSLQDPGGHALLGVAGAAALGTAVARHALDTPQGRLRVHRGLAIAASAEMPRDPGKNSAAISGLEAPTELPKNPPDPWYARLVVGRLGLEKPPVPALDDPPPPPAGDPGEPVDYEALLLGELGPPPDPAEALRTAALEACEAHAVWAVGLRSGAAACALALVRTGASPGPVAAALHRSDQIVGQAIALLQEIAAATRGGQVPVRGLRNGLARSAQLLVGAHRTCVEGLANAGAVPFPSAPPPAPLDPTLVSALQDGRALPEPKGPPDPSLDQIRDAIRALASDDREGALKAGEALHHLGTAEQDGIRAAAGALFQIEALVRAGDPDAAVTLRDAVGRRLAGARARSGLSLLARWRPEG